MNSSELICFEKKEKKKVKFQPDVLSQKAPNEANDAVEIVSKISRQMQAFFCTIYNWQ